MPAKDTYIQTSNGEYSDYCVGELYYVLKDFCFIEQLEMFLLLEGMPDEGIEWGKDKTSFRFNAYGALAEGKDYFNWLVKREYLKVIPVEEYHTGSYGNFEMNL
jgi:hypothetical protein